jgi:hypothetical protein
MRPVAVSGVPALGEPAPTANAAIWIVWAGIVGTAAYMFWGTLRKPRRS